MTATFLSGEIVLAATHYDAMTGLATRSEDLKLTNSEKLTCIREMLTGTHVPTWHCRYDEETAKQRASVQLALVNRPRSDRTAP